MFGIFKSDFAQGILENSNIFIKNTIFIRERLASVENESVCELDSYNQNFFPRATE